MYRPHTVIMYPANCGDGHSSGIVRVPAHAGLLFPRRLGAQEVLAYVAIKSRTETLRLCRQARYPTRHTVATMAKTIAATQNMSGL